MHQTDSKTANKLQLCKYKNQFNRFYGFDQSDDHKKQNQTTLYEYKS